MKEREYLLTASKFNTESLKIQKPWVMTDTYRKFDWQYKKLEVLPKTNHREIRK